MVAPECNVGGLEAQAMQAAGCRHWFVHCIEQLYLPWQTRKCCREPSWRVYLFFQCVFLVSYVINHDHLFLGTIVPATRCRGFRYSNFTPTGRLNGVWGDF